MKGTLYIITNHVLVFVPPQGADVDVVRAQVDAMQLPRTVQLLVFPPTTTVHDLRRRFGPPRPRPATRG